MDKRILMFALSALLYSGSYAKVKLPHLISDNMIIQSDTQARLWGWDKPGKTVNVKVSWSSARYTAKTGSDGKWEVKVKTPQAGYTPLSITFDDGDKTVINNVLAGEVWVCGGQSNMEMPVRGFGQCPLENYNEVVLDAKDSKGVRYARLPMIMSMTPLEDTKCEWKQVTPATVGGAGATSYFFARLVSRTLGIPVGVIEANKGGTRVEAWLNRDNLKAHTDEALDSASIYKRGEMERPLVWGNGTFNPALKYTIKGILYYQGCANVGNHPKEYADRLALLVDQWRKAFGEGQIPFYFVEIAPFNYEGPDGTSAAFLREQQHKAAQLIPNSGIVCTNDCVYPWEGRQIHPAQKRKVGERLAFWALTKTYGFDGLIYKGPEYQSMKVEGDKIRIKLKDTFDGIAPTHDMTGFEIAGSDKIFHKATAESDWNNGIVVSSPEVKNPVAVRYCYRNFLLGNVYNQGGLPLLPFRTDNW